MANKTMGTLKVDFAGTREEAAEFVKQHPQFPLHVGNGFNLGNDGMPQLTMRYVSEAQRITYVAILDKLGWEGCIDTVPATK